MRTPSAASCAKRIGIVARATPLGPKATLAQLLITQTALELLAELRELYGSFRIALTVADFRQPRIALALMAGDALLEAPNRPLHVAFCEKDIAISAEPALHVVGKGANRLRTLDNRLLDDRILHNLDFTGLFSTETGENSFEKTEATALFCVVLCYSYYLSFFVFLLLYPSIAPLHHL